MTTHIQHIASVLQGHMTLYGYELIDLPIIEPVDLFLIKAGDPIINALFTFERHNRQLALRPEFTAGAAAHYTQLYPNESPVVRWQYNGSIFQDPPGNASSAYQQYSVGAEIIGTDSVIADTEIVSMAVQGVTALGIDDFRLIIGHTGLTRRLLSHFQLDTRIERFLLQHAALLQSASDGKEQLLSQLRQLYAPYRGEAATDMATEIMAFGLGNTTAVYGGRTREDIARRLAQKRGGTVPWEQIVAAVEFLDQWEHITAAIPMAWEQIALHIPENDSFSTQILKGWQTLIAHLEAYGIPAANITIKPSLARNWEYYTGIVFELTSSKKLHIGGGGRYNDLIQLISQHEPTAAVGFAYNMNNLVHAIPYKAASEKMPLIELQVTPQTTQVGIQWAKSLRQKAVPVTIVAEGTKDSVIALWVDDAGNCRTEQRTYTPDEIEQLVADLKELTS